MTCSTSAQCNVKTTHVEAAHVDFDAHAVVVLSVKSDLVQEVEVGSRVLQRQSTRSGYAHLFV